MVQVSQGVEVWTTPEVAAGRHGEGEFQAEVEIICRRHHGYCISQNHHLPVYDFVANDTMHHNLHGRTVVETMPPTHSTSILYFSS
jgi:hypothetical protein